MSVYSIHDRLLGYSGPYGFAKKEDIHDLDAERLDQEVMNRDSSYMDTYKGHAKDQMMMAQIHQYRRDIELEKNSREELPKSEEDIKQMDVIPYQVYPQIDISHPSDYKASNAVKLLQQSIYNSQQQETIFTDPNALKKNLEAGDTGNTTPQQTANSLEKFSFEANAAGRQQDRLHVDVDGQYTGGVNQDSAF